MDNRHEPENGYRAQMEAVKASVCLKGRVMDEVRRERCAAEAAARAEAPGRAAAGQGGWRARRGRLAGRRFSGKRVAVGACAAMAAVLALALVLPGAGILGPGLWGASSPFVVEAYGGVEDPLLPNGRQGGRVVFNCETETQRYVPMGESYENEGCYTGCMFSVQGEGIVRVQADVSVGELYRMESVEYTLGSDPELAQELSSWKPSVIGQGELLGWYELVKSGVECGTLAAARRSGYRIEGEPVPAARPDHRRASRGRA